MKIVSFCLLFTYPLLVTAKTQNSHQWDGAYIFVLCLFFILVAVTAAYLVRMYGCHVTSTTIDPQNNQPNTAARGLDVKVVEALPSMLMSEVRSLHVWEGGCQAECAVCLNEFKGREIVKLLPGCLHMFHTQCISPWLASHVTCPICRVRIECKEGSSVSKCMVLDQRFGLDHDVNYHGQQHDDDHVIMVDSIDGENSPHVSHRKESVLV